MAKTQNAIVHDIGLSFSGVNRATAEELDAALKLLGVSTFLDSNHKPRLAGEELTVLLPGIYKEECFHCVPLISKKYVESVWAKREKNAALERALIEDGYLIPVRLDDTEVPGISGAIGYLDARRDSISEIADVIATKLLQRRTGMPVSDARRVSDFTQPLTLLTNSLPISACPLGQAHMVVGCEKVNNDLIAHMYTEWNSSQSNVNYEASQQFPTQHGKTLITEYSKSWPSYDLQLTFIDDQLNVYAHLDLAPGFNLLNSNLPKEVKFWLTKWRADREQGFDDEQEEASGTQFFAWSDSLISSRFRGTTLTRGNIGTITPYIEGGSSSGPWLPVVYVFGEIHFRR